MLLISFVAVGMCFIYEFAAYTCLKLLTTELIGLLLCLRHMQAEGLEEPSQKAPHQVCTGSGPPQGPSARSAASPQQRTRVCWRSHRYQGALGKEHAPWLKLLLLLLPCIVCCLCVLSVVCFGKPGWSEFKGGLGCAIHCGRVVDGFPNTLQ